MRDVFICHASEDKKYIVAPLVEGLNCANISCWYDEAEIKWGDSITQKVNEGLSKSRYVVVVLSSAFVGKNWPQRELYAVLNQEAATGEIKVLPLLVGNEQEKKNILAQFPLLNDKSYLSWQGDVDEIVSSFLIRIKRSDVHSKEQTITGISTFLKIPLPELKKKFSQHDKDIFLRNGFIVMKGYFQKALQELEHHYEEIKTEFVEIHNFKFSSTIYIRGDVENRCKIWMGGGFMASHNSISYQAGRQIDINNDNSYNDWLTAEDNGKTLGFRPMMGLGGQQSRADGILSAEKAAEYLWKRFTENIG